MGLAKVSLNIDNLMNLDHPDKQESQSNASNNFLSPHLRVSTPKLIKAFNL